MRSTTQRLAAAAAALIAATALAACGSDGGGDSTTEPTTESSASAEETTEAPEATEEPTAEVTEEPTTEAPTALSVTYDVTPVDFGAPGDVTPPGTPLTKGQPAWLNQTVTVGEEEITGGVGVTVLEVRELDPALFDQFNNAEEFAGYTPYAIITQHQWLYDVPEGNKPTTIDLFPVKEDGSDTEYLTSGFSFNAPGDSCGLLLPEYDPETRTLVSCFVGLTTDLPITTAKYNGEGYYSIIASSDNQYFAAPLLWN